MQPLMSALQQTYGAEGLDVATGAAADSIEGEPGPAASRALVTSAPAGWWHHPDGLSGSPPADVVATDDSSRGAGQVGDAGPG